MVRKLLSAKMPLVGKFFISSVVLILILCLIIGITMNIIAGRLLSEEIIKYHTNCLKSIDNNLTYITDKIEHLAENTALPKNLAKYDDLTGYGKFEVSKEIADGFSELMVYKNILGITLIFDGHTVVTGQHYNVSGLLDDASWPEDGSFYSSADRKTDLSSMAYLKRISIDDVREGLMVIQLSPTLLTEIPEGTGVFALNEKQGIIWTKNTGRAAAEAFAKYRGRHNSGAARDVKFDNAKRYISQESRMGGIELVMCIDSSIFGERNSRILNFVLLIAAGVFLLCVIFSVVVSRIITTRINVLEKKMRNFIPGSAMEKVRCRRGRLRNQIVLYYLLVCFVPIVVMSVSYYSILVDIIEEEVINSFNQSAGHISDNIIMSTDGYAVDGRYIAGNSYIQQLLRENREPESRRLWPVIKVAAGERGCENLTLYRADGSVLYSLKPICTEKLETAPEKIQWLNPHYDLFGEKVASILIPINSSDYRLDKYMERIGYLKIDFREDILSDALLVADSNDAQVYITDRSGYIIAAEHQTEIGKKADEIKKGARVISEQPVSENWQMCAVMQTGRLLGNRKMILLYCFMVLLMALILITLIGSQIASIIVTPIQMLNEYLKSPLPRKIGEKPELKTGDEIEQLCNSFNDMSAEIERLINEVYEAELAKKELDGKKKEAQLYALQAQINPHFLYNTFESINWLILRSKNETAVDMINSLSDIFRLGINRGENTLLLRDEIHHAKSYINIQKMRYGDKLSVEWEYSEDLLECTVTKTVLQPVLENAIYHGLEPKEDGGEIEVCIERINDELVISIIDDGVGIAAEEAELLNSDLRSGTGNYLKRIGLKNVNDRIILMFGDKYGVSVNSVKDKFTEVIIKMPYVPKNERL